MYCKIYQTNARTRAGAGGQLKSKISGPFIPKTDLEDFPASNMMGVKREIAGSYTITLGQVFMDYWWELVMLGVSGQSMLYYVVSMHSYDHIQCTSMSHWSELKCFDILWE